MLKSNRKGWVADDLQLLRQLHLPSWQRTDQPSIPERGQGTKHGAIYHQITRWPSLMSLSHMLGHTETREAAN